MKRSTLQTRFDLVALALLLLGVLGYVLMHAGPLAPLQVTVIPTKEGRLRPPIFGIGTVSRHDAARWWSPRWCVK